MISGVISLFAILFFAIIALAVLIFWIWMLIDAIQNKGLADGEKVGWVLAIIFLHFVGALLYFFLRRRKT